MFELLFPCPSLSEQYIPIDKSSFYLNELLKEGICYSPPFPR